MNNTSKLNVSVPTATGRRLVIALFLLACLIGVEFFYRPAVTIAAPDVGYQDFSYTGVSAPTGQKPQSKLWITDNRWYGMLYNNVARKYQIYRFDWTAQAWSTTGVAIDGRSKSSGDALWDGSRLYVVSAVPPGTSGDINIYMYRFSYNAGSQAFALDAGFPVSLGSRVIETVVMDKDTLGNLWVTFTDSNGQGGRNVYVMHTTTNDTTWTAPYVIPTSGSGNLSSDDISAIVQFNGKIGVMWSNQTDNAMYFAYHVDGDPDSAWTLNPALQARKYADDHINLKSLQADASGQVFATVKTSLNDIVSATSPEPLILLLTLDQNGGWSRRTVGRVVDNFTRPIVLIDNQNRQVYVFYTYQYGTQTSGAIYYKQASLDNPSMQFPDGLGTPFMVFGAHTHINNASSTKQALNSTTDLLVIGGDDTSKVYFHNSIDLGAGQPTPTFTATATLAPIDTFTPTVTATNTEIPAPTFTATAEPPSPTPTDTAVPTDPASATPTDTAAPTDPAGPTPTLTTAPIDTATPTPTETAVAPSSTPLPPPTQTAAPTQTPVSSTLLEDGFESGDLSAWDIVRVRKGGSATVQSQVVLSGVYAALLSETSQAGSVAFARKTLSSAVMELYASGDFQVITEGSSGGNVPLLRLFDPNGNRILSVYRLNLRNNQVGVEYGGKYYQTSGTIPLNTWATVRLHVIQTASGIGTVEIFINGTLVYQSTAAAIGSAGVSAVQIGNDTAKQAFAIAVDNILVTR